LTALRKLSSSFFPIAFTRRQRRRDAASLESRNRRRFGNRRYSDSKKSGSEDVYSSQVAAQIPRFISQQSTVNSQQLIRNATVLNGIDVLEKNNFKELDGLKIGLVTNHTGKNLSGRQTIDVLKEAKNVKLVALFSPEHGIRGSSTRRKLLTRRTSEPACRFIRFTAKRADPNPNN
jgi:hypothetical protein